MKGRDSPPRPPSDTEIRLISRRHAQRRDAVRTVAEERTNQASGVGALLIVAGIAYVVFGPTAATLATAGAKLFALVVGPAFTLRGQRGVAKELAATLLSIDEEQALCMSGITEWQFWSRRVVVACDAKSPENVWWLFEVEPSDWLALEGGRWLGIDMTTIGFSAFNRLVLDGAGYVVSFESDGPEVPVVRRHGNATDGSGAPPLRFSPPSAPTNGLLEFEGDPMVDDIAAGAGKPPRAE